MSLININAETKATYGALKYTAGAGTPLFTIDFALFRTMGSARHLEEILEAIYLKKRAANHSLAGSSCKN